MKVTAFLHCVCSRARHRDGAVLPCSLQHRVRWVHMIDTCLEPNAVLHVRTIRPAFAHDSGGPPGDPLLRGACLGGHTATRTLQTLCGQHPDSVICCHTCGTDVLVTCIHLGRAEEGGSGGQSLSR